MPFGSIPVFDEAHRHVKDFRDLTGDEPEVLSTCGFSHSLRNSGYIEQAREEGPRCRNLNKFIRAFVISVGEPKGD